jgi:predicted transcriptional regulator
MGRIDGRLFRARRVEMMVSVLELARRAEMNVKAVYAVESGVNVRMGTMRRLLEALGLTIPEARGLGILKEA